MVTKDQKQVTIEELKVKFGDAKAVYATTQKGLTVKEISDLRKILRAHKAEYKVAKNTLIGQASVGTSYEQVGANLFGPTALVFCYEDAVAPIGEVKAFSKEIENKIEMVSGLLDGEYLDVTKLNKLANLPGKKVLLSQIAGMLVQPASMIAYILKELSEKGEGKILKDFLVTSSDQASKGEAAAEPEAKADGVETDAAAAKPEDEKQGE